MKKDIILREYNFSNKTAAVLITVCVLLSLFVPFSEVKSAEWYDSGWIYADDSRFHGDEEIFACNIYFDHGFALIWGAGNINAWIDLNVSAGNYKIDMKIGYSHRTGTSPQTNETMRVETGSDSANISDMGDDIVDSYEGIGCLDVMTAIETYTNVTGRTLSFSQNSDLNIKGTGDSLILYAVRIYGYKEELGAPNLVINKTVDKITANPGDEIVYTLNYQNTGNGAANNVIVKDPFNNQNQNYLTFVSANPSPTSGNDTWNIGTLNAGQSGTITIRAKISNDVPTGYTQIQNRASIDSNETDLGYSNYVSTWAYKGSESISLNIDKLVRNISRGYGYWTTSVYGQPEDEIEFLIKINSIGDKTAENVRVRDSLPANISVISNSTTIDGVSWGGDVVGAGLFLGALKQGQTKTIKFRAKIADDDNFGPGSTTLINTAYTSADNVSQISDQALVVIVKPGEVRGAEYVPTGANTIGLGFLAAISAFVALFVYCRTREEKLLEILNSDKSNKIVKAFIKLYFRIKFFITVTKLRFKQIYW